MFLASDTQANYMLESGPKIQAKHQHPLEQPMPSVLLCGYTGSLENTLLSNVTWS